MPYINAEDQYLQFSKLEKLPDAIILIDVDKERTMLAEAKKRRIPVIAIVDSIVEPDEIDYPIPGNDDAERSILFFCSKMANAILGGMVHN